MVSYGNIEYITRINTGGRFHGKRNDNEVLIYPEDKGPSNAFISYNTTFINHSFQSNTIHIGHQRRRISYFNLIFPAFQLCQFRD